MKLWVLILFLLLFGIVACRTSNGISVPPKILKEEAAAVAERFLKDQYVDLGSPVRVEEWSQKCSVVINGERFQTWDGCYFVVYQTPVPEKMVLGERMVAVTLDGSRAAFALRD